MILRQTVAVPDNATKWLNHGRLPFWALYCSMPYRITQFLHSFLSTSFFLSSVLRSLQSLSSAELMKHCHGASVTVWAVRTQICLLYDSSSKDKSAHPKYVVCPCSCTTTLYSSLLIYLQALLRAKTRSKLHRLNLTANGPLRKSFICWREPAKIPQLAFSVEPCR